MGYIKPIAFFDSQASIWGEYYQVGGSMRHRIGRFRQALALKSKPGEQVLDIGCGTGQISCAIAQSGWEVTGCDISARMLERAQSMSHANGPKWVQLGEEGVCCLPFSDARFDVVIASSVIEYVANPNAALTEISRVLRAGGWTLITVPDVRHSKRVIENAAIRLLRFAVVGLCFQMIGRRDHAEYLQLSVNRPSIQTWQEMFRSAGLMPEMGCERRQPLALIVAQKVG